MGAFDMRVFRARPVLLIHMASIGVRSIAAITVISKQNLHLQRPSPYGHKSNHEGIEGPCPQARQRPRTILINDALAPNFMF